LSRAFLSGATIQGTDVAGVLGITCKAAGAIGINVTAHAAQSAKLQQWSASGGSALAHVRSDGLIGAPYFTNNADDGPYIGATSASLGIVGRGADVASPVVSIVTHAAGKTPFTVGGFTGQVANLQEWRNVGGVALAKVDAAGAFIPPHLVIAAAVSPTTALAIIGSTGLPSGLNSGSAVTGIVTVPTNAGAGQIQGVSAQPTSTGSSLNLVAYLGSVRFAHASLVATSGRVFEAASPIITAGGTITTATGVNILAQKITGVTTGYGVNQQGVDDLNAFAGRTTITAGNAAYIPLSVVGAVAQSTDLQQWRSSAAVVAQITSSGGVLGQAAGFTSLQHNGAAVAALSLYTDGTHAWTLAGAGGFPGYVPLSVRGAPSQTADVQQWQASDGSVSAAVDASGAIAEKRTTFTPTAAGWYRIAIGANMMSGTVSIKGEMDIYQTDLEFAYSVTGYTQPGYINLTRYAFYNGGVVSQIRISSDGVAAVYLDIYIAPSGITYAPVTVHARGMHQTALVAAPVVGAVAGSSSVNVLTVGGGFRSTTGANFAEVSGNVGIGLASPTAKLAVTNTVAATAAVIVKAAAAQSAPLVEWRSSANALLAMVRYDGLLGVPYLRDPTDTGPFLSMQTDTIVCSPPAANLCPLTVRGFTSQSNHLQQWQNSGAGMLAGITAAGALDFASTVADKIFLYGRATASAFGFGIQANRLVAFVPTGSSLAVRPTQTVGDQSSGADVIVLQPDGVIGQTITAAASVGHSIKGAAAQSAPLSEWRSSANALLASVRPDGEIRTVSIRDLAGTSAQLLMSPGASPDGIVAYAGTAAAVVFQVRGQTVQTGDLQQWHNNFIVHARVTAGGLFGIGSTTPTARVSIYGTTDIVQLLVRGHSTQTNHLQQWKSSADVTLAQMDGTGRLTHKGFTVASTAPSSPVTGDVWIDTST
jgi:hypothetical protein